MTEVRRRPCTHCGKLFMAAPGASWCAECIRKHRPKLYRSMHDGKPMQAFYLRREAA